MHVSAPSGEYYILADFPRPLNVTVPHRCRAGGTRRIIGDPALRLLFASRNADTPGHYGSETMKAVFGNRRFACLALGMWLGAAGLVDLAVTQNFATVDRFIESPGSAEATAHVNLLGPKAVRYLLRRNAAEENAWIFEIWEWAQMVIAPAFFFLILFGERPPKLVLILVPVMFAIVLVQRFALTPNIVSLGRELEEIPANELYKNPIAGKFWLLHGFYSGFELAKLAIGLGTGFRLMIRRSSDHSRSQDRELGTPIEVSSGRQPERRRKRRSTDVPRTLSDSGRAPEANG